MSDGLLIRILRSRGGELALAILVALVFLGTGVWQRFSSMGNLSTDWDGLMELMGLRLGGTPLGGQIGGYVAALLLLHVAMGVLAWLLAVVTQRAFNIARERRLLLVAGWSAALVAWVLIANATLYSWSTAGIPSSWIGKPLAGGIRLLEIVSVVLAGIAFIGIARVLRARFGAGMHSARLAVYSVLVVSCLALVSWADQNSGHDGAPPRTPNVIIIGIDSLRADLVGAGQRPGLTPNLDAFVRDGSQLFSDTITPLARTFPALTSVLSGRYPRFTAARENLIPLASLNRFDTIARIAQRNGYRTVFATDEVRFSNIDESFGFDQVITPTMGAADFLLGKFNDLPLVNLFSNSRLGAWMFPATYANRAAAVTYRPETFVERLDAEISSESPTLLVTHLALPHHPYVWAEPADKVFARATDNSYQYTNAVIAADRQFGAIMELLEHKGLLRNALVIVLSDHGEALGLPDSDTLLSGQVARSVLDGQRISLWGHGSSVLSPHQFAAFLAIRPFGAVDLPPAFHEYDVPVSLVDIAPTIVDAVNLKSDALFDGASLLPLIRGDSRAFETFSRRLRFTESGFRTKKIEQGDFDERSVLGDVATYFRMNPATARFELRPDVVPYLLADKERAVLSADWLLASIPDKSDRRFQKYLLVSRRGEPPVRLEHPPADDGSEIARLWGALREHYGAELLPPARRDIDVRSASQH